MSATTHTPGPWRYQENSDAYTHIVRGPNDEFVCSAPQDSSGRAEADMRLVAALPELLAALKGFVRGECPIVTHHRPDCLWCAALKVIAKAEGKR